MTRKAVSITVALSAVLLLGVACSGAETDSGRESAPGDAAAAPTIEVPARYILKQDFDVSLLLTSTSVGATTGWLGKRHTCEGFDTSPHVQWAGVLATAEDLVFMIEDPASDAFGTTVDVVWNHWVVYSIPTDITSLDVGQQDGDTLENGSKQGTNDFGNVRYNGPCPVPNLRFPDTSNDVESLPPIEDAEVRPYMFRLYALDTTLTLSSRADRDTVLEAIDGHIVAAGELAVEFKSRTTKTCFADDIESCLQQLGPRW